MRDILEYDEEDPEDEIPDEDDEMRMAILEAEANEVWLEEPGDEEDEADLAMNPLFGLSAAFGGIPGIPGNQEKEKKASDEDPEC